jgi:NAD(P)-dependent dehydrogenase (short-subunit alcohol dehydrogenase family)
MSIVRGKMALVTGAGRGLGRGVTPELGRLGSHVVGARTVRAGQTGLWGAGGPVVQLSHLSGFTDVDGVQPDLDDSTGLWRRRLSAVDDILFS